MSHYTVGLDVVPGYTPPPPEVDRSTFSSANLVVVRRSYDL